jgi:hypothetical protein
VTIKVTFGRVAGKFFEFMDKMRLVVISALIGYLREGFIFDSIFHQGRLETNDPGI